MTYSIIGILAAMILLIINRDILWISDGRKLSQTQRTYCWFLMGILAYLITDMLWGILESHRLTAALYVDTVIHFAAMAAAVMLWTRYVVSYLESRNRFGVFLSATGRAFLAFVLIALAVNLFQPVIFWFDETGAYHAGTVRYLILAIQILLFLLSSIYTIYMSRRSEGSVRRRHLTIGLFGIAMVVMIAIQVFFPLLPFYAMGYMLGTCLLHSYVVEDEKEEYRHELEESLQRERLQKQELSESREALNDALAAAEEANRAKTAFLSNMSHEIRTPMNAIIGLNNIAMNDPSASDKLKEHLIRIDDSAQHLLGIINEILDMSRIESGRMVIKNEEFSFAKCLEQVNIIISGQCRDKGLRYDCRTKGRIDEYYIGDGMKLKQVLINILGNAVKFTPEGGSVDFDIEEVARFDGNATLRFIIQDTGIGMSKEYLPHIFDAFSQEDSSSTSQYGSTGLGMPITKSIVELMNGHIEVESEKGEGSTFTVTLTFGESHRKSRNAADSDLDPDEMNVLVIDDDPIALEHARIVLSKVGIHCETAESGSDGVELVRLRHARRENYNLILIDWRMPEMDGVETTRQIRSVAGNDTPIIILTSFNWDDIADEARAAGVDTFVPKPLFAESVLDEFREAFKRKNEDLVTDRTDLTGRHILLAEDVAVNAEIIVMVLSMREVDVDVAENGKVAVEMFETHPAGYYDAILMDMRMPVMDGLEATRAIRASDHSDAKTIPVIALTANAFDEDVQRSMQAGLNAHLSKPVEPDDLFKTLETLIK
ncbi:MAG: response regulator [Mogibacterium sp.]|nr:response regulator [Mogibacterium sp.]